MKCEKLKMKSVILKKKKTRVSKKRNSVVITRWLNYDILKYKDIQIKPKNYNKCNLKIEL